MTRATGPHQSYTAKMQDVMIGSDLAQDGDKLFINNKTITTCAAVTPTHECAHMDLRQIVYNHLGTKSVDIEWICGHAQ